MWNHTPSPVQVELSSSICHQGQKADPSEFNRSCVIGFQEARISPAKEADSWQLCTGFRQLQNGMFMTDLASLLHNVAGSHWAESCHIDLR